MTTHRAQSKRLTINKRGVNIINNSGLTQKNTPREKKALIMKLKLMVVTVKRSRKTKTRVGSL